MRSLATQEKDALITSFLLLQKCKFNAQQHSKKNKCMLWISRKGREMKRSLQHHINALVACLFSLVFNSGPSSEKKQKKRTELAKLQRRPGLINVGGGVGSH